MSDQHPQTDKNDAATMDAAVAFRASLTPRADQMEHGQYPLWYGWALYDAFIAGAAFARSAVLHSEPRPLTGEACARIYDEAKAVARGENPVEADYRIHETALVHVYAAGQRSARSHERASALLKRHFPDGEVAGNEDYCKLYWEAIAAMESTPSHERHCKLHGPECVTPHECMPTKPSDRLREALHNMGTHSPAMLGVLGEHLSTAQAEEVLRLTGCTRSQERQPEPDRLDELHEVVNASLAAVATNPARLKAMQDDCREHIARIKANAISAPSATLAWVEVERRSIGLQHAIKPGEPCYAFADGKWYRLDTPALPSSERTADK